MTSEGRSLPVVEWVHAFDDTDCFDGDVERDQRFPGTYWCGEAREVRMTGETAPARTPSSGASGKGS